MPKHRRVPEHPLSSMPPIKENQPLAPEDVIREDSGPSVTRPKTTTNPPAENTTAEPQPKDKPADPGKKIDIDDAMIEEPKDGVFKPSGKS
ncbi:MAG: hypothetical protein ABI811_00225 [Acidobacteriota bacterium]